MVALVLAAKSTADQGNKTPSAERLINCYTYPAPQGAKASLIIRSVRGVRDWSGTPGPFLRAMARVEGQLYVVTDGALWLVPESGDAVFLASVDDDPNTTIVGHRDKVTVAADGTYYLWSSGALSQPGSGALSAVSSVAFLDQYTMLTEADGRRVEWTEVADPSDRNGLHFATAEARDDKIIRAMTFGSYLMVFKEHSTEMWANTGLSGSSAFRRVGSEVAEKGIKAFNLACWTPEGLFWVGEDNIARLNMTPVSPPNVTIAITEGEPTHCFHYEDRGVPISVIRFGDRPAWCFDHQMAQWHERSSGVEHKPWDVICSAYCYGQWHLGDRSGRILRLGANPFDAGKVLRRTIVSRNLFIENKRFTVPLLQVNGLFGRYEVEEIAPNWITDQNGFPIEDQDGNWIEANAQGPITTIKRPGKMWARFSRDGGNTYGLPKTKRIGKVGQHRAEVKFHALGQFKDMTVELNLTDPVDVPLLSEAVVEVL
jgi:hypothetical protein